MQVRAADLVSAATSRPARAVSTLALALTLLALSCAPASAQRAQTEPEAATGITPRTLVTAKRHMVVAAHPLATRAGLEMLRAGGSALDAAIAVQLALGLVEPQSSGLGGGAFLLHWDNAAKDLKSYDGRERAPAAAREDRFLLPDGRVRPFGEAVASGLSVGVPGVAALLETVHKRHGSLPWATLFEPALRLAEQGFPVSPRLHGLLSGMGAGAFSPEARGYFFDAAGAPWPAAHRLANPAYAATLRAIRDGGAAAFYQGAIAQAIVAAVAKAPRAAGGMTLADLAGYSVIERAPLCFAYRRRNICGMGPPSSGGVAVATILQLVEPLGLKSHELSRAGVHLIAEAEKLAFADRNRYLADPDFVAFPRGLLEQRYLAERRRLIDAGSVMGRAKPGTPPAVSGTLWGEDATHESAGTSHISVLDAAGNAVAITTTIEAGFGSRLLAAGFLLNNELTDFSFRPRDGEGRPVANRVEGGKRPRSSMAPTIVFGEDGAPEAVLGSPGGPRIILYVTKALVGLLDWGLDAQEAAALPNFGSQNAGALEIEEGWGRRGSWLHFLMWWQGHQVSRTSMTSGLNIIRVTRDGLEGGTDPRREGLAAGD